MAILVALIGPNIWVSSRSSSGPAIAYDTGPIDWKAHQSMLIPGLPRATAAEPFSPTYVPEKAGRFLDDVSVRWTQHNRCGSCHTNISYLMARPRGTVAVPRVAVEEVRSGLIDFADKTWRSNDSLKTFMLAPIASALAVNDGISGLTADSRTIALLDRLWSIQDPQGGWYYRTSDTLAHFWSATVITLLFLSLSVPAILQGVTSRPRYAKKACGG